MHIYIFFPRYLHVVLMNAERAWSYAMELKLLANTEPRKHFHMLRRLKKATQHALQLKKLSESEQCDARTKLEAQVEFFYHLLCVVSTCFLTQWFLGLLLLHDWFI